MNACSTVNPEIVTLLNVNDFICSCVITFLYFNVFYGAKSATVQLESLCDSTFIIIILASLYTGIHYILYWLYDSLNSA